MSENTVVEECWATHEALRRLKVPPEDIFINKLPWKGVQIMVEAA